ncbi:hypothetical protein HMI55_006422 [Coelomomyces lativittatus]|nr:hypothetical protein HMI55_006422 [Coelomomyces lativittatus]KAJ1514985.1 hypothetical protein HMI56_006949 [Coelomomyces lativittatus]
MFAHIYSVCHFNSLSVWLKINFFAGLCLSVTSLPISADSLFGPYQVNSQGASSTNIPIPGTLNTQNNPQLYSQAASSNNPQLYSQGVSANNPQYYPQGVSANNPQYYPQGVSANNPQLYSQGVSANNPQYYPQGVSANNPQYNPQGISMNNPQYYPQGVSTNNPQYYPQAVSPNAPLRNTLNSPNLYPTMTPQAYPTITGQSLNQNVPSLGGYNTFSLGSYQAPLLPMEMCMQHKKDAGFNERIALSRIQQYGLDMKAARDNCKVSVTTEQQLVGTIDNSNFEINLNDPVTSNKLLYNSVDGLFTKQGWLYNLFYFNFQCSKASYCIRALIWDDMDPRALQDWMNRLDKQAQSFIQMKSANSLVLKEPNGLGSSTLASNFITVRQNYVLDPKNEEKMLRFINTLIFIDLAIHSGRVQIS